MSFLILLWVLIGLCLGLIALPARLYPALRYGWLVLPAMGVGIAVIGGLVGVFLLGKDVATGLVLWVTVVGLWGGSRIFRRKFFMRLSV